MMGYCCRSSSLSHSGGVRGKMERGSDGERERQTAKEREREREAAAAWGRERKKKKALIPIGPQDMRV